MLKSIFMLSKYLKKTVTAALILGLMISPILPATQSISSSISIATQAAEIEVQLEEAQASTGYWSDYTDTAWYYNTNPDESNYTIATAEELAGLAKLVNDGTYNFAGKTIKLADNINLGDHYWVPIGVDNTKPFRGNFDGQGYTISNMHIGTSEAPANYAYAGLFGYVKAGAGQNVTIQNVNIDTGSWVYSEFLDGFPFAGGICAKAKAEDSATLTISNCSNSAEIKVTGNDSSTCAGGICASACANTGSGTITIKNCRNNANIYAATKKINTSNSVSMGGICAEVLAYNGTITINNCSNSAEIKATNNCDALVGGICADTFANAYYDDSAAYITIKDCSNNANISSYGDANNYTGGICAYADSRAKAANAAANITITDCSNNANISSSGSFDAYAGGICTNANAVANANAKATLTISNCSNGAEIKAEASDSVAYAGGICSKATSRLDVYANARTDANTEATLTISNCSNSAEIKAAGDSNAYAGGICADTTTKATLIISSCSNSAEIKAEASDSVAYAGAYAGEICAFADTPRNRDRANAVATLTISNCYYKEGAANRGIGKTSNQINPEDQPGKTTALPESQMTAAASTTNGQGWVDITINGANKGKISLVDALNYGLENSEYVWIQKDGVNNNYPYSLSTWLIGDGIYVDTQWYDNNIEADDYTINTAEELAGLAKLVNIDGIDFSGVTITLGDNINLSAHDWEPIGTKETPFKGTFDGNNKTISGMLIYAFENQKQLGLFGNVESGTIKNVNIDEDCYISTCQNTASAGGICGYASDGLSIHEKSKDNEEITTTIINCSSKATIIANSKSLSQIGGIVGATSGVTINNCHNMGSVKVQSTSKENTGEHNVGGIVGYCVGATDIIGCINEGDVLSSVNGNAFARAGGIVGASSYTPSIGTTKIETIVDIGVVKIKNCQNFGNVESNCIYNKLNLYDDPYYTKDLYTKDLDTEDDRKLFLSSIEDNELFSSYAGGIIGELGEKTEVTNCISLGTVKANTGHSSEVKERETDDSDKIRTYAGGICGGSLLDLNELKIENCAFGGNVEATTDLPNQISDTCAGGIYGKIETEANATITISNCYYKKGAAATGIANEVDQAGEITALPETQMTAAEGTIDGEGWVDITLGNIQEKMALVDALNTWVRAYNATNPSVEALGWKVTTGSYPTLNPNQNIASTETNTATDANAPADEGANTAIDIATDAPADEGANVFNNGTVLYDTWCLCADGIVRYVDANGIVDNSIEGRMENGASDYTYYSNGVKYHGLKALGSKQYLFNNGQMVKGGFYDYSTVNGTYTYYVNNSGEILYNFIGTFDAGRNTSIYTYNHQLFSGEFRVETGDTHVFDNGIKLYDTWHLCADGIVRYVDANGIVDNSIEGRMENGTSDYTYYSNGVRCHGFITIGSKQYLFNNGQMIKGGFYSYSTGNGTYVYYINKSGEVLQNFIGTFDAEMNIIYTYNNQLCSGAFEVETGVTYVFNNGIILQ